MDIDYVSRITVHEHVTLAEVAEIMARRPGRTEEHFWQYRAGARIQAERDLSVKQYHAHPKGQRGGWYKLKRKHLCSFSLPLYHVIRADLERGPVVPAVAGDR